MRLMILALAVVLSGCSTVMEWVPSFWDPNQSAKIVDIRVDVEGIDCSREQMPQLVKLRGDLQWFRVYSQTKGRTQADVLRVVEPIRTVVDEWVERGEGSRGYCTIKRKLLLEQTERAATVVQGRW